MARYTGPRCELCRYIGDKLMLKGDKCSSPRCPFERRGNTAPGGRSSSRTKTRRRVSDRGLQLREKQKVRFTYGVLEAQFRRFFEEAKRLPGTTSDNVLTLLERRLDNVVFRLGFGQSRPHARQIVRHGHIWVNDRRVDVPSFVVSAGDVVSWRPGSTKTSLYKVVAEQVEARNVPSWLRLDEQQMKGTVVSLPTTEDVDSRLSGKAVVEYYSR